MSKVYEIVTNALIEELEKGNAPWKSYSAGSNGAPVNAKSNKKYRGVNHWTLWSIGMNRGYTSNQWLTYKQAQELGGQVRKGERSAPVLFAKTEERDDGSKGFCVRFYQVFNANQIDGLSGIGLTPVAQPEATSLTTIEKADAIINNMPQRPSISHRDMGITCYRPMTDDVIMPTKVICSSEEYYSILFHELAHSTGHESRLNRDSLRNVNRFGTHEYSKEELVAEFTAALLSNEAGILPKTIENSAAYCRSWLKILKNDRSMLVNAASQASKAADFILKVGA